ncbi:hypothetical protein ERJ75_001462900 [Trypanosoma vivax]|nr:hypothetical protein ERJ75_001462900 [Trypanosoma vivax]
MEGSSGDAIASALRWVKYGDVYYAALIVPEIEAPSEVPDGHEFVYFLGDESGAVVPSSDVEPFDPNMRERATHPEAIAGVRAAEQLLLAAEASGAETGQTLAPANRKEKRRGMQQAKAVGKGMKNKNGYGENNGDKSYGRFSKGDGDAWNGDEVAVARADVSGVAVDHGVAQLQMVAIRMEEVVILIGWRVSSTLPQRLKAWILSLPPRLGIVDGFMDN